MWTPNGSYRCIMKWSNLDKLELASSRNIRQAGSRGTLLMSVLGCVNVYFPWGGGGGNTQTLALKSGPEWHLDGSPTVLQNVKVLQWWFPIFHLGDSHICSQSGLRATPPPRRCRAVTQRLRGSESGLWVIPPGYMTDRYKQ